MTICEHCRPIRAHAQANQPYDYGKAFEFGKQFAPTRAYGDCECRCHDVHRAWVGPS